MKLPSMSTRPLYLLIGCVVCASLAACAPQSLSWVATPVVVHAAIAETVTAAGLISRGILVVVIAALASLYPAWQASRKEPSKALHHV